MIEIRTHWSKYGDVVYHAKYNGIEKMFYSMEDLIEYLKKTYSIMGKSKEVFNEIREQENMIVKNNRIGGYDIYPSNGVEIWIAGSMADAKRELANELKAINKNN